MSIDTQIAQDAITLRDMLMKYNESFNITINVIASVDRDLIWAKCLNDTSGQRTAIVKMYNASEASNRNKQSIAKMLKPMRYLTAKITVDQFLHLCVHKLSAEQEQLMVFFANQHDDIANEQDARVSAIRKSIDELKRVKEYIKNDSALVMRYFSETLDVLG